MGASSSVLMTIAIIFIMFGIGLNIPFSSFRQVFTQPRALLTGLISQLLLLPCIAFLIANLYEMDPAHKVGLMLIAACPGGTASNLVTYMVKGRVALSVALTAFNSFLIIVTIPIIIALSTWYFMDSSSQIGLSFMETFQNIGLTVVLPVLSGMVFLKCFPDITRRMKTPLRYLLPLILLFVFSYALLSSSTDEAGSKVTDNLYLIIPALALNLITIFLGYLIARRIGVNRRGSYTIAIEMGLQNSALAIFIAEQVIQNREMMMVPLIYSSFTFFTTLGAGYLLMKRIEFMPMAQE